MSDLKPCPFCGGKASHKFIKTKSPYRANIIYCIRCGVQTRLCYTKRHCVVLWNKRRIDFLVRCAECVYWQDNNGGYPHKECRWGKGETPDADDFCSYGERREDG